MKRLPEFDRVRIEFVNGLQNDACFYHFDVLLEVKLPVKRGILLLASDSAFLLRGFKAESTE